MKDTITPYDVQRVLECQSVARDNGVYWTAGTDEIVLRTVEDDNLIGKYRTLSELEEALNNL